MSRVQNRVELLPVLFEEIRANLLNFDKEWNPFQTQEEIDIFEQVQSAQIRLLLLIEAVEGFLTKLIISKHSLFDVELGSESNYVPQYHRPLEESFFNFNHIFKNERIFDSERQLVKEANCFSYEIQYGADLELCLEVLGSVLPEHFRTPYEFLGFKNGKCVYRGAFSRSNCKDSTSFYYPKKLSTNEPTLNHKKILNELSIQLRELLHHPDHTKLVNSINTNAIARQRRATEYVDSLFERYRALTFVSMDLYFDYEMELPIKQKTLAAFKNRMRKYPILNRMVGYLGKWEYSFIKDTYIRMIFIFPKLEQHVQEQMPEIIGTIWVEYTRCKGSFHRAYLASQPPKLNQTVCTITEKNKDLRTALEQRALYYLTHSQEYYRYKYNSFSSSNRRYKPKLSLRYSKDENDKVVLIYLEPRDIFFKGELTGEALERNLEKKRQRAEEKSHMEKEKNIEKLDEPESIEKTQTDG